MSSNEDAIKKLLADAFELSFLGSGLISGNKWLSIKEIDDIVKKIITIAKTEEKLKDYE